MKTSVRNLIAPLCLLLLQISSAEVDPAQNVIGKLKGTLIYATNAPEENEKAKPLSESLKQALTQKQLPYSTYYHLGEDRQDVYKGYQNWLKPIQGSEKLMLSFESKNSSTTEKELEISFWQDKKKIFCTKTLTFKPNEPMIITGPKWRNGKVIIILTLD